MATRFGLLGKKAGMTQTFDKKGVCKNVSVIELGPCVVLDIMTSERNGYSAIKLGFDDKEESRTTKPAAGVFARAKTSPKRFVREIRLAAEEAEQFEVGQVLTINQMFEVGDKVDVTGTSKGKGFQGVMKRYHFAGFKASHGTHEYFRHGGSIGCRLTPGRVVKGKKMPGQMGNKRVTVQNVTITEILPEKNLLLLSGAIPGAPDSFLMVKQAIKHVQRSFTAAPAPAEAESEAEQA